jgi:death-on-curing protein
VDLAARLAYGLAKNHGFVDGNKRTAFIPAYVFLAMNGIAIQASKRGIVGGMEALASSIGNPGRAQERFADWEYSVLDATTQEGL